MFQNSDIRSRSRKLYLKNFKLFMPYFFVVVLLNCVTLGLQFILNVQPIILFFANVIIAIVTYPICVIGLTRASLSIWREESVSSRDFFAYFKDKKLLHTSLAIGAVYTVVTYLLTAIAGIPAPIVTLASSVVQIYFMLHFVLAVYIFILDYESGASDCISASFSVMKGVPGIMPNFTWRLFFLRLRSLWHSFWCLPMRSPAMIFKSRLPPYGQPSLAACFWRCLRHISQLPHQDTLASYYATNQISNELSGSFAAK